MARIIHDYTNARFRGISDKGKAVICRPNPRYNPLHSNEPRFEFDMLTPEELDACESLVSNTLDDKLNGMRRQGVTRKTITVYFLEHNQANLARLKNDFESAYRARGNQADNAQNPLLLPENMLVDANYLQERVIAGECAILEQGARDATTSRKYLNVSRFICLN